MRSSTTPARSAALLVPLALLSCLLPGPARAQGTPKGRSAADSATRARPTAVAARRTGPIDVDGTLAEAAWDSARAVTSFTQQTPDEGDPPTQRTRVRFLYDGSSLYIGARMQDTKAPSGIAARLARRDDDPRSDELRVDLDPYHDRLHHVTFTVDPAGWRGDASDGDDSWDPVWEAATSVDSAGWTAEIRIPFSQLRFSGDSVQTWGLEVTRVIHRRQEEDLWSFYGLDQTGGPSFYGTLEGIRVGGGPAHAEILPYVTTRMERLGTANPESPFYEPHPTRLRAGGDLKYLVSSSFTLSATVNPDFGQVEVDPAVVNLTQYEIRFQEKRPFFVQGSDVFDFGSPGCNINCGSGLGLFYSRRIGAPPPGAGLARSRGEFVDVPDNTTILGAAKLTGRTPGGTTVGILDALTGSETARVARTDGTVFDQLVAPLTNDFVGRVKQDLEGGNLVVGGLLTSVDRRLRDGGLADLLPSAARAGGADVRVYWDRHAWSFYAAATASRVAGDSAAILRLQRSSARYFQRPDRTTTGDGLFSAAYRPGATALAGYGTIFRLAKQGGSWIGDLNGSAVSPGFETNDLGFRLKSDELWLNGSFGRQFLTPTGWYRSLVAVAEADHTWNYDGDPTGSDVTGYASVQLLDYWGITLIGERAFPAQSDRLTRGGPVVRTPGTSFGQIAVSTDSRRALTLDGSLDYYRDDDGGHGTTVGLSASFRPSPNVQVSLGPRYGYTDSRAQYVAAIPDPTATAFYGHRYVFAHLAEKQLSMETRVNVTFTPDLSFELFLQPLLASARFGDFEEFAAPRREEKLVYGMDIGTIDTTFAAGSGGAGGAGSGAGAASIAGYTIDPDGSGPAASFQLPNPNFDPRSLRGTAVLRWEWRPGSTAYLVWTQTRGGSGPFGDLSLGRDISALGNLPPDNTFELKITYWLPL